MLPSLYRSFFSSKRLFTGRPFGWIIPRASDICGKVFSTDKGVQGTVYIMTSVLHATLSAIYSANCQFLSLVVLRRVYKIATEIRCASGMLYELNQLVKMTALYSQSHSHNGKVLWRGAMGSETDCSSNDLSSSK